MNRQRLLALARQAIVPVHATQPSPENYAHLLDLIGDAKVVMIGEASHGTHEFYHHRAEITKLLIEKKGFTAVAVEADWPDAYHVNRYVRGMTDVTKGFSQFKRFPTWMWRNDVTLAFARWLRKRNDEGGSQRPKTGFYGLDMYSLRQSAEEVVRILRDIDPSMAQSAKTRYACFDHYGRDPQRYGMALAFGRNRGCEEQVVRQLTDMARLQHESIAREGFSEADEIFYAYMNAKVVKDAEAYYRQMYTKDEDEDITWNMRDRHMTETLQELCEHLDRANTQQFPSSTETKVVLWAHNSHLGDARQTDVVRRGQKNVGQFVRELYGLERTFNIGFTTYTGTVTAADEWDEPGVTMNVRRAESDTLEYFMHEVAGDESSFYIPYRANPPCDGAMSPQQREFANAAKGVRMPERAIGVIYRPATERWSHYFDAAFASQFDAIIHIDKTKALKALKDDAPGRADV